MERIFSKVKIFILKKIVFPVLQLIAKYKAKKKIEKKTIVTPALSDEEVKEMFMKEYDNPGYIADDEPVNLSPKQYGQYLQQTGKQIWVKKLK
jgi:hypothetical protein